MAQVSQRQRESYITVSSQYTGHSYTDSSDNSDTNASGSTIWGPGALTGKALLSIGEAMLRAAEIIIIRRRLAVLESRFPIEDAQATKTLYIEELYDDLLELSRDHYSTSTRRRAFRLLVNQVDLGETQYLIKALAKWPPVEIRLFATEFMSAPFSNGSPESIHQALLSGKGPCVYRFLIFACQLSRLNPEVYNLLVIFGLLDMILHICIFPNELWMNRYQSRDILAICDRTLWQSCTTPKRLEHVQKHPLADLWPTVQPFFLREDIDVVMEHAIRERRCTAWARVSSVFVEKRLFAIGSQRGADIGSEDMNDSLVDLGELTRTEVYGEDVAHIARTLETWNTEQRESTLEDAPPAYF